MKLTGEAEWTTSVNRIQVECECGNKFFVRSDRWQGECPECGNADSLRRMRAAETVAKGIRL